MGTPVFCWMPQSQAMLACSQTAAELSRTPTLRQQPWTRRKQQILPQRQPRTPECPWRDKGAVKSPVTSIRTPRGCTPSPKYKQPHSDDATSNTHLHVFHDRAQHDVLALEGLDALLRLCEPLLLQARFFFQGGHIRLLALARLLRRHPVAQQPARGGRGDAGSVNDDAVLYDELGSAW